MTEDALTYGAALSRGVGAVCVGRLARVLRPIVFLVYCSQELMEMETTVARGG